MEVTLRMSTKGGTTTTSVCSAGLFFNSTPSLLAQVHGFDVVEVHLPVADDEGFGATGHQLNGLSRRASSPGRSPSSTSSSEAPPPVETKLTWSSRP